MKHLYKIIHVFLILTALHTHSTYCSDQKQKKVVTIRPENKVKYLELYAEQNKTKAQQGLIACFTGALAGMARLYQKDGRVDKTSLGSFLFAACGGAYAGWCTWSAKSAQNEADDLKEEHNIIVVHYNGNEDYLETNCSTNQKE